MPKSSSKSASIQTKTIVIGATLGLTGEEASYNQAFLNGIKLAVDVVNQAGGLYINNTHYNLSLIYYDDGLDPQTGLANLNKLVFQNGALFVTGLWNNPAEEAFSPQMGHNAIMMAETSSDTIWGDLHNPYIFMNESPDSIVASVEGQMLFSQFNYSKLAILFEEGEADSLTHTGYTAKGFEASGGKLVFNGTFDIGQSDFSAAVVAIKNSGADILYMNSYSADSLNFIKQARAAGLDIPVFVETIATLSQVEDAGALQAFEAAPIYVYNSGADALTLAGLGSQSAAAFVDKYNKTFGMSSYDVMTGYGYDYVMVDYAALIKAQSTNVTQVQQAMENLTPSDLWMTVQPKSAIPPLDHVYAYHNSMLDSIEQIALFSPNGTITDDLIVLANFHPDYPALVQAALQQT